jgi:hypothetical protein
MKSTGNDLIDVLRKISRLEWYRGSAIQPDGSFDYLPFAVWRFDQNEMSAEDIEHVISTIRSVLGSFNGKVPWSLELPGRNWVLTPLRARELELSRRFRTDGEIEKHLAEVDPAFCADAHADFAAIASDLSRCLTKK